MSNFYRASVPACKLGIAQEVDGGAIVGFTYLGPSEVPDVMELGAIHVDPAYVGSGVGRQLMCDALPHLGDRAVLWVLATIIWFIWANRDEREPGGGDRPVARPRPAERS